MGTSRYSEAGTVETMLERWGGNAVYVSELRPLTDKHRVLRSRVGTGVSGFATAAVDASEYLSLFNADWPTPDIQRVEQLSVFSGSHG